jgi:hypothetical protein
MNDAATRAYASLAMLYKGDGSESSSLKCPSSHCAEATLQDPVAALSGGPLERRTQVSSLSASALQPYAISEEGLYSGRTPLPYTLLECLSPLIRHTSICLYQATTGVIGTTILQCLGHMSVLSNLLQINVSHCRSTKCTGASQIRPLQ